MRSSLLALSLLLCACSSSEEPSVHPGATSLLARRPDRLTWQAGKLQADPTHQWGELGQFGWETTTRQQDGLAFVWTNRERSLLTLPCGPRADRTLALTVLGPPGRTAKLVLGLNGHELAQLNVTEKAEEHEIHAPLQFWIEGENLLELSSPLQASPGSDLEEGVGVARVTYGETRKVAVDVEHGRVRLETGTSVRYRIEPLSPGRVLLGAHADGPGKLVATLVRIDPESGKPSPGEPEVIAVDTSLDLERAFVLPDAAHLTELCLAWEESSAPGSELELRRLEVQELTPPARPPIILISVDTLSARHLSLYGYPLETSPALERIAQESFVFDRCLTNAPWTLPSFMSLMSGLYANANRLEGAGTELWEHWYLSQNRWTLAEFLRAAGYRTAGFVDNAWITEPFGFPQGFDEYDASAAENNIEKTHDPNGGIRQTTAEARRFLAEMRPDQPFFLFVHCFDMHAPYAPPAPYSGHFDEAEIYDHERTAFAGGPANIYGIIPTYVVRGELPEGEIPTSMHTAPFEGAYDESLQFVDEELGKFFEYLRAGGVLDRAWVIVTADHGETMADTPYYFGHGVLDQDVVQIPLLIRPPGGQPGGKRVSETVQLADLYPTLVELLGSKVDRSYLHGRSLLPVLRGGTRAADVVLTEGGLMRQAMLVADGWKLIELEPSKDVRPETLLSHPILTKEWFAEAKRLGHARQTKRQRKPSNGPTPEERDERFFGWTKDDDLERDFFERLPRTGLTEELLAEMHERKGFKSLITFLKRALDHASYELYDLRTDPQARHNVASQYPDKLLELRRLLEREQKRREVAKENAVPPTQAVDLDPAAIGALHDLGYGGESGAPEPDERKQEEQPPIHTDGSCRFRVELASASEADEFGVLDARGAPLVVTEVQGSERKGERHALTAGRSDLLAVHGQATTLVLYRAGSEVRRVPLQLAPGKSTIVRP